jgi:hypothetical protein
MEAQMNRNGKEVAHFGVPWEKTYGYAQAVRVGNTIYVAGQLSHDDEGNFIGPATRDSSGRETDNIEFETSRSRSRSSMRFDLTWQNCATTSERQIAASRIFFQLLASISIK